jgi:hypothetical protein
MDLFLLLQDFTKCVIMEQATDKPCFWFMELDHISEKIKQARGNITSASEQITHISTEALDEYLPVTEQDSIAMMIGLRHVIKIPTIMTPNKGGVTEDTETMSMTHSETRSISDWSWNKQRTKSVPKFLEMMSKNSR